MTVKIDTSIVSIGQHVAFDIVLSTPKLNPTISPKKIDIYPEYGQSSLETLMKDIGSMDVALTFGVDGRARNIALWAHRSVLAQQPGLAMLISKLKSVEGSRIQSHHVYDYSLEGYCSLIRFLYTGKILLQVNLDDFAIGCPPNKPFSRPNRPFSLACNEQRTLENFFSLSLSADADVGLKTEAAAAHRLMRATTFSELFLLADCYEDLKDEVLQYVSEHLDTMYSDGEDPFEKYKDHPESHTLLASALKMRYMDHSQNHSQTICDYDEDEMYQTAEMNVSMAKQGRKFF
ncbi:hypothetical protein BG000_004996 [Podila horticola]|nr:hypothetical protein BG000_004996 [Podila horticola]